MTVHFWHHEPRRAMAYEKGRRVHMQNDVPDIAAIVDAVDDRTVFKAWTWDRGKARRRIVDESEFWKHMAMGVAA
jgi:hypothetical protein